MKHNPPAEFLLPEVRRGYKVTEQVKKLWAVQLDMLQELLEVCQRHNLRAFADGGTLIGAIREHGYIPWDDDIDIMMLREDYDRLLAVADDEFHAPYFFQTIYSDEHYTHRHAQLRNSETAFYNRLPIRGRFNHGIFVDIFPVDYIPDSPRKFFSYFLRVKQAKLRIKMVVKLGDRLPEFLYQYCRRHTRWLSDEQAFRHYENVLRSVRRENTRLCCELCLKMSDPFWRIEDFSAVEWRDFEYIKIPVPVGYDNVLRSCFGDYMTPVMAPSIHGKCYFDTEQSYRNLRGKC